MPPLDTDRLAAIINAAQSPAFKKLLDDKTKAQKSLEDAKAHLAEVESKLRETIPPALKSLLEPPVVVKPKKEKPSKDHLKKLDLQELKQILDRRPGNTLNIRQDGFDSKAIKAIVSANPSLLSYESGPWPKVRYAR